MKPTLLLAAIVLLASCGNDEYIEITDQCVFINLFSNSCFQEPPGGEYDEFIFKDNATFLSFTDSMRLNPASMNCDTATAPSIDFENYVLLGKYASGGGCNVDFRRRIYRDITDQNIIYQIDVKTSGWCDMLGYSNNWVLLPKSLYYEDVVFIVNE